MAENAKLIEALKLPHYNVGYFNEEQREFICEIVREWLSYHECECVYGDYLEGYNDLLKDLKADLK